MSVAIPPVRTLQRPPHRGWTVLALLVVGLLVGGRAQAQAPQKPSSPPPFEVLRAEEDYRYLRAPDAPRAPLDGLKYLPLNEKGSVFLSLGGDLRQRVEYYRYPDWAVAPAADGAWLQRYMLHGEVWLWDRARTFFQLKSGWTLGREGGPGPTDEDRLDVHQAFVEARPWERADEGLQVRLGRQELQFGSARLVSVREGPNVRRTFDGVRTRLRFHRWDLSAFAVRPVATEPGVFDDGPVRTQGFWGLYAVHPVLPGGNVDVYYLGFSNRQARYAQGEGREQRHSFGTRWWGKTGPWDYNLEAVLQVGRFSGAPLLAWTVASNTGFTLERLPLSPRLGVMADIASGDPDAETPSLGTFNPLFPRGSYFGEIALLGPYNFIDLHPVLRLHPSRSLVLSAEWTGFWRQSVEDGIYGPSGVLVRPPGGSSSRWVGHQVNLTAEWELGRYTHVYATASRFFARTFLRQTGSSRDVDLLQAEVSLRF
ncbi:alginate export family protein [Archangium sp.]|uniref:alginate export family protein n=1 Tax=Archangium sp. TaxID=1872627 RepID=UPI003899B29A